MSPQILLLQETGLRASFIPFRSGPDALRAAMRGDIHLLVDGPTIIAPQVADGSLNAIVVTGRVRSESLPGVPTVAEAGHAGATCESWMGLVAPPRTPAALLARVSKECQALRSNDDYARRLHAVSFKPQGSSPEEFAAFIDKEHERWARVLALSGLKID